MPYLLQPKKVLKFCTRPSPAFSSPETGPANGSKLDDSTSPFHKSLLCLRQKRETFFTNYSLSLELLKSLAPGPTNFGSCITFISKNGTFTKQLQYYIGNLKTRK